MSETGITKSVMNTREIERVLRTKIAITNSLSFVRTSSFARLIISKTFTSFFFCSLSTIFGRYTLSCKFVYKGFAVQLLPKNNYWRDKKSSF